MGRRGKPATRYDRVAVEKRFGIPPERLPGYVALVGDPADDIPKVKGIGKAIASQLMSRYASVAELLDEIFERASDSSSDLRLLLPARPAANGLEQRCGV